MGVEGTGNSYIQGISTTNVGSIKEAGLSKSDLESVKSKWEGRNVVFLQSRKDGEMQAVELTSLGNLVFKIANFFNLGEKFIQKQLSSMGKNQSLGGRIVDKQEFMDKIDQSIKMHTQIGEQESKHRQFLYKHWSGDQ